MTLKDSHIHIQHNIIGSFLFGDAQFFVCVLVLTISLPGFLCFFCPVIFQQIRTLMNNDFQTRTWLILLLRSLIVLVAWSLSSLQSLVSSSNLSVTSSHWCFSSPGKIEEKRTRLVQLYLRFKLDVKNKNAISINCL